MVIRDGIAYALPLSLVLIVAAVEPGLAQRSSAAGSTIERVLARQFPEWMPVGQGQSFHRTSSGIVSASWTDGTRRLTIEILETSSPEALEMEERRFDARQMMPPNRPLAFVGDRSRLYELSDRVQIGFTSVRDLLHVQVDLMTPGPPRALLAPAPPLEVERIVTLTRAMAGALGATGSVAWAAGLRVDVAERRSPPPEGVPSEARGAGVEPEPGDGGLITFGVVKDPGDQGPLSSWVVGKIASAVVTWSDPDVFSDESAIRFVRARLGDPAGNRFTFVPWSQALGRPMLAADVRHVEGRPGRILIWRSGTDGALYAYLNGEGRWSFGVWRGIAF